MSKPLTFKDFAAVSKKLLNKFATSSSGNTISSLSTRVMCLELWDLLDKKGFIVFQKVLLSVIFLYSDH